jgi:uncharacterized protein with HEPN domain
MSRSISLYLTDILTSIEKIQKYTASITYDELLQDELILDGVLHNLQIIGEATKQIPDGIRIKYPQIQWKQIAGLRDIITHAYFSINTKIVWNIIETKLEPLKAGVETILARENLEN